MMLSLVFHRLLSFRAAGFAIVIGGLLASGCSDGSITSLPQPAAPPTDPGFSVAELTCTASVLTGNMDCGGPAHGADASNDWIIGGQNVNVRLTSTNVVYDSVTQIFQADVTVRNLRLEKFGTDGVDTTGVYVFFHQKPRAVSGSGTVTVRNADGTGTFTASDQPFFRYPEVIGYNAETAAKRWEWNVPRSVIEFNFKVFVSTRVLPVIVFDLDVGGNTDIYRVALDGSDLVRITTNSAVDAAPAAGPGMIVFTSTRDGNQELFRISPFGGPEQQLTFTTGITHDAPAVSSDGQRIAYARVGGSSSFHRLRVMDVNGGDTAAVAGANGIVDTSPRWKPHSDSLVFMSAGGFADSDAGIYRTRVGGAAATGLITRSGADIDPAWSPDGRSIAFSSPRGGSDDLYLMDLTTLGITRLTSTSGGEYGPAWTPDGRIVFVYSTGGGTKELRWLDPSNPSVTHAIPGTSRVSQQRINHSVFPF